MEIDLLHRFTGMSKCLKCLRISPKALVASKYHYCDECVLKDGEAIRRGNYNISTQQVFQPWQPRQRGPDTLMVDASLVSPLVTVEAPPGAAPPGGPPPRLDADLTKAVPPESWRCPQAGSCGPPACSGTRPLRRLRAPGTWQPPWNTSSWCASLPCSGARSAAGQETPGSSWQFWRQREKASWAASQWRHLAGMALWFL